MSLVGTWAKKATSLLEKFSPPQPISAGLYHFKFDENGNKCRIHLRLDNDLSGVLLVDANRVLKMNPSSAVMAYLFLKKFSHITAVNTLADIFDISREQAEKDYIIFSETISHLVKPDSSCPVCEMNLEIDLPFSTIPSAPYRMDLALTYRCNNSCHHCYNEKRSSPELSVANWKVILDKLWKIGIPHVVFTGGEPTLFKGLPELISHAEANGQITGINTNGRMLKNPAYLEQLVNSGLDHIQVTLESHHPSIHDQMVNCPGAWQDTVAGIRNALDSGLFVMTNTTLLDFNSPWIEETLDFLAELGVPTVGLNALIYSGKGISVGHGLREDQLIPLLDIAREKTNKANQRLIWYTPTQYCHFDPIQLQLGVKGCTAALYNMCVEPDGSVIPCQSYYVPLGNLLTSNWEKIWQHPLAVSLRERKSIPQECQQCSLLAECGGGCPLAAIAGQLSQPKRIPAPLSEILR
jgi:radical SAM protein with 4Fe4S-binding SPASM domain